MRDREIGNNKTIENEKRMYIESETESRIKIKEVKVKVGKSLDRRRREWRLFSLEVS